MIINFSSKNFKQRCHQLAKEEPVFKVVLDQYGYPPLWSRPPAFATLIHIILEQQVSLASAKAALDKLKNKIGIITPARLLTLSDSEMRSCYFSRQKMGYARGLAKAILSKKLVLKKLSALPDEAIRVELKKVKGIGDWTVDVYLLFALQRADVFPLGDLAMINALKEIKALPTEISRIEILKMSQPWKPYRSIATMLLWHYYIKTRNIKL